MHVWTFDRLNAELHAQRGRHTAQLSKRAIQQTVAQAVARCEAELRHYDTIAARPGFVAALADLLAELKRAQLSPDAFRSAVAPAGARLLELADLFAEYEVVLAELDWLDPTGLALAAREALGANPELAADWALLIIDGFEDFDRARLAILGTLALPSSTKSAARVLSSISRTGRVSRSASPSGPTWTRPTLHTKTNISNRSGGS